MRYLSFGIIISPIVCRVRWMVKQYNRYYKERTIQSHYSIPHVSTKKRIHKSSKSKLNFLVLWFRFTFSRHSYIAFQSISAHRPIFIPRLAMYDSLGALDTKTLLGICWWQWLGFIAWHRLACQRPRIWKHEINKRRNNTLPKNKNKNRSFYLLVQTGVKEQLRVDLCNHQESFDFPFAACDDHWKE